MTETTAIAEFLAARDLLLDCRGDYDRARRRVPLAPSRSTSTGRSTTSTGCWPSNAATQEALRLIEDDGSQAGYTFAELADRSSRLAGWLRRARCRPRHAGAAGAGQPGRAVGVHAGLHQAGRRDHSGHHAAVAGGPGRPAGARRGRRGDRPRGPDRAASARRGTGCRSRSANRPQGWLDYAEYASHAEPFAPDGADRRRRPAAAVLHLRAPPSKPKLVEHTHVPPSGGPPLRRRTDWATAGRRAFLYRLAGLGQARRTMFFAPGMLEANDFISNYSRFNAKASCWGN